MQDDKYKAMRGEFKGDFTRDTFDPINHFSRVLMQQGRVQLDADWNEQASIVQHQIRNLACDLGGEHWGAIPNSFEITPDGTDFSIGAGNYYVNGILCEVGLDQKPILYSGQPDYPIPDDQEFKKLIENLTTSERLLIYLDVWERHISYLNDDSIREVALGGPDTATRAQIVWQVKVMKAPTEDELKQFPGDFLNSPALAITANANKKPTKQKKTAAAKKAEATTQRKLFQFKLEDLKTNYPLFLHRLKPQIKLGSGKLSAKVKDKSKDDNSPCLVAPESRYRGAENQLYRVEVHMPGNAETATFKWSRENASVIFPIIDKDVQGTIITLEHLGRDCRYGLKPNDWVELIDDDYDLQNRAEKLIQIESIDHENRQITLKNSAESDVGEDLNKHPYLRRWDQTDGDEKGIKVRDGETKWLDLEDGIQIQFHQEPPTSTSTSAIYQTGDYWLIPARTVTGDIEWPTELKGTEIKPIALPPHGVKHHYAPLAILSKVAGNLKQQHDLRRIIKPNWE